MKAISDEEFIEREQLQYGCLNCGGALKKADIKNITESGEELPRFFCVECNQCFEQTDDYVF